MKLQKQTNFVFSSPCAKKARSQPIGFSMTADSKVLGQSRQKYETTAGRKNVACSHKSVKIFLTRRLLPFTCRDSLGYCGSHAEVL